MAHIMLETSGMASPYPTARLLRNEGECRATNSLANGRGEGRVGLYQSATHSVQACATSCIWT